jgi:hypothetical protein
MDRESHDTGPGVVVTFDKVETQLGSFRTYPFDLVEIVPGVLVSYTQVEVVLTCNPFSAQTLLDEGHVSLPVREI